MAVEKKDLDWGSLGFSYMQTDYSYEAHWKDGEWDEGGLTTDHTMHVSECGGIFHYCQEVFEGLKAYTTESGDIVCFRPDQNAKRMFDSAQRLEMPPFPEDRFVEAVKEVVKAQRRGRRRENRRHALRPPVHDRLWQRHRRRPCSRVHLPHPRDAGGPLLLGGLKAVKLRSSPTTTAPHRAAPATSRPA